MYKYEFTMINGQKIEFVSKLHISVLNAIPFEADGEVMTFVLFNDTRHFINLTKTKKLKINDVEYQLRAYTVH